MGLFIIDFSSSTPEEIKRKGKREREKDKRNKDWKNINTKKNQIEAISINPFQSRA